MAVSGFSSAGQTSSSLPIGEPSNPYLPSAPIGAGSGSVRAGLANMTALGQALAPAPRIPVRPTAPRGPDIAFDRTQNKLFVQGTVFDADDADSALQAEALLGGPGTGLPTTGNWEPMDVGAYQQYLSSIKNPSMGRLASKSFGRGVDQLQMLGGSVMQLAGAEELGGQVVAAQEEQLRKTSPFERQFTDIGSSPERGVMDWLVANIATQGPNILESIAAGLIGAAAGTAAGPGIGTAGGFIAGIFGKKAFKDKIAAAATKYRAGTLKKGDEGYQDLVNASAMAGAAAATYASSYAMGAGDIYGEMRAQGTVPEDFDARMQALAGAVPYAALESLGEYVLAGRVLGNVMSPRALAGTPSALRRGGELLRRGAIGAGVGGALEGTTEVGQEAISMGLSGQDLTSDEALNRFINSFAAGAAIGGPIGGVANLRSRPNDETSLLTPPPAPAQLPALPPPAPLEGTLVPPDLLSGPTASVAQLGAPLTLPPPGQVLQVQGRPNFVVDSTGTVRAAMPEDVVVGMTANVPGQRQGQQGVLNILGGQGVTVGELTARMQPTPTPLGLEDMSTPVSDPRQGALQFAPEAPSGIGYTDTPAIANPLMRNRLQDIQNQMVRGREFEQAQAQRQAQIDQEQAQREQDYDAALRQQQAQNADAVLQTTQAEVAAEEAQGRAVPSTRQYRPTQPQQGRLDLNGAPVSRGEAIRRGAAGALPANTSYVGPDFGPAPRQGNLFTQKGEPTVAAMKSAGTKTKVVDRQAVAAQAEADADAAKAAAKKKAAEDKLKKGRKTNAVQKQSTAKVPPRKGTTTGQEVGGKVPTQQKAAPKGEGLKKPKVETAGQKAAAEKAAAEKKADDEVAPPRVELKRMGELARKLRARMDAGAFGGSAGVDAVRQKAAAAKAAADKAAADKAAATARQETRKPESEDMQGLREDIAAAEESYNSGDVLSYKDAIAQVFQYAYFAGEDTNIKKLVDVAREFLANRTPLKPGVDASFMLAEEDTFLEQLRGQEKLQAAYPSETKSHAKGELKPWFNFAVSRGLLPAMYASGVKITNVPDAYKQQTSTDTPTSPPPASTPDTSNKKTGSTPEVRLMNLVNDILSKLQNFTGIKGRAELVARASALYNQLTDTGKGFIIRGNRAENYFRADGTPKINTIGNRHILTVTELTDAQRTASEQEQRAQDKVLTAEARAASQQAAMEKARGNKPSNVTTDPDVVLTDFDKLEGGMFYRDDGTPLTTTVAPGKVRLLIKNFLSQLRVKPTVSVYANVADLKKSNPALYRRAAAARSGGDFDTTNAVGYSFGPDVIIFTDFVRTERQLKFVLAHETLGHFGLRGVIPQAQLSAVLNRIYDSSTDIQADVQARMSADNIPKAEAIEEYLADNAADLDASLLNRVWNLIKTFLNKFGVKFHDDHARYFVNLARKYVRRGDTGNFFTAQALADGMNQIMIDGETGRYSRAGTVDFGAAASIAGALNTPVNRGIVETFRSWGELNKSEWPRIARAVEHLQSLNNKAQRSYGLSLVYKLFDSEQKQASKFSNVYNHMTAFTNAAASLFGGKSATEAQKLKAGELLARAALLRSQQFDDAKIRSFGPLVSTDAAGNIVVNELLRVELERVGVVTADEFRKGFDLTMGDKSTIRFQSDVDDSFTMDPATGAKVYNDPVWRIYSELRSAVNQAAIDKMLAEYGAVQLNIARSRSGLENIAKFDAADLAVLARIAESYKTQAYKGSSKTAAGVEVDADAKGKAEAFLIAFGRALFNPDVYAVWMKEANTNPDIAKDLAEFQKAEYDDIRAQLSSLRDKVKTDNKSYDVQKVIRDMFMLDNQAINADLSAKRTILNSYIPFTRRGNEEVRLVAVNDKGKIVKLDPGVRDTLPYFHTDSREGPDGAYQIAQDLENDFAKEEYTLLDAEGNTVKVKFRVDVSTVRQNPGTNEGIDFNAFINTLTRLNIGINPKARERIITTLTNQNARIRRTSLQRSGTPGWDKDVVRSVSEHLQTMAHVSAKTMYRDQIRDVMDNDSNWKGDAGKLAQLERAVKDATTDGARAQAKKAYDTYAYMYRYMAASSSGAAGTVTVNGKKVKTLGRGEDYRLEANKLLEYYAGANGLQDATEDLLGGEVGSQLKTGVVAMQLGGALASAAVNLSSIPINLMNYLAWYNPERAFGGGYGYAKSASAVFKALSDIKNNKFSDSAFIEQLIKDNTYANYGLTRDEAQFLLEQTESGLLQAALFNALLGTARGRVTTATGKAGLQAWMYAFNYTEQVNRRTSALAAYRLERDRLVSQGMTDAETLFDSSTVAARQAVISSQGEYGMFNRPPLARGPIGQYLMMYKMYPIITVELMRNLPRGGQIAMLGTLFLLAGMKGLPFGEDILDLLDTIAQALGLPVASLETEIMLWIEGVAPGWSQTVLRGGIDSATGLTISPRLSMGNLLPLTGALRAGADPWREFSDFAGPMFSGVTGLLGTAANITKYGAETIGLRDDTTLLSDVLRNSPVAGVRAITDGLLYMSSGTITNNRGQVVSQDAPLNVSIGRLLGFYPAAATEQNDIVRLGKQASDYAAAIKGEYVGAYIKAKLANDSAGMQQQIAYVREWDRSAKGSGLEIGNNFVRAANRSAKEAERSTVARYLKSSSRAGRDNIEQMADIFGLNEELD